MFFLNIQRLLKNCAGFLVRFKCRNSMLCVHVYSSVSLLQTTTTHQAKALKINFKHEKIHSLPPTDNSSWCNCTLGFQQQNFPQSIHTPQHPNLKTLLPTQQPFLYTSYKYLLSKLSKSKSMLLGVPISMLLLL